MIFYEFFIVGGYRLVYDRDCPVEIFVVDEELIERVGHPVSSSEVMLVKILVKVRRNRHDSQYCSFTLSKNVGR